ncbi:hypothetical protein ACWGH5_09800 [Streptomyces sp. NPDC054864]
MLENGTDGPRIIAAIETAWEVLQESHPELPDVYVIVDNAGARHNLVTPDRLEADMRLELPVHRDAIAAGPRAVLEAVLHVATHALCQVRGVSETSNRGMRHNKHFRDAAVELGMKWPTGEPPHATKGFSPVPLTPEAESGYAPLVAALGKSLDGVVVGVAESPAKGKSGTRLTLQCECTDPVRTFQIGPRIASVGPIVCGVCGAEFTER